MMRLSSPSELHLGRAQRLVFGEAGRQVCIDAIMNDDVAASFTGHSVSSCARAPAMKSARCRPSRPPESSSAPARRVTGREGHQFRSLQGQRGNFLRKHDVVALRSA